MKDKSLVDEDGNPVDENVEDYREMFKILIL